jgi:hypothetical protein
VTETTTLGRERIVGRTVLSLIGKSGAWPLRCPRCPELELLDVNDVGCASCRRCSLEVPAVVRVLV